MIYNNSSIVQIDKSAVRNNIEFIREQIGEHVTLSSVVKANAYGHGIDKMVPLLEEFGVHHFSVFSSFEARVVHEVCNHRSTIMTMGNVAAEDYEWIVENGIESFVYNCYTLNKLLETAKRLKKRCCIHVELETGMNRHGFPQNEWNQLIELLKENQELFIFSGLCTHFAGAESTANYKRIQDQQHCFLRGIATFREKDLCPDKIHSSCSAAILAYPEFNHNLVRVGILTYGLWPSTEIELTYKIKQNTQQSPLQPVLSWRSRITDISEVKSGEFIGYGNSFLAETDMKIASVPVGYGYGFNRSLSNAGRVIVNGHRLSVIGMVNMNMFLIDATNVDIDVDDTVTIIGRDQDKTINVSHFGKFSDTMNYELLTRIDRDIPRVLV